VRSLFKWISLLRKEGGSWSPFILFLNAWHNNKHWHPEGDWPYGMRKRDKSQHRLYTSKYEDLCM